MIGTTVGLAGSGTEVPFKPDNWEDHWPLPPAGATATQIYEWRLRHQATDAINGQTATMKEQVAEVKALYEVQKQIRDILAAESPPTQINGVEIVFQTIDKLRDFPSSR